MGVGMLQLLLNTYECQHGGQNQTLQEQNHCVETGVFGKATLSLMCVES